MESAIIKTLAYFDIFNYPLKFSELKRFLWSVKVTSDADLKFSVEKLIADKKIETRADYYFLPGRSDAIATRVEANRQSELKLPIAIRAAKLIRSVPFVKSIFICNSVGFGQASADSDIDFFVITTLNRVWIARLFTNLILRLFGLRTYGDRSAGRVCLSFYLDQKNLNLASLRISDPDIYLAYWLFNLSSLYDPSRFYESLTSANGWVEKYLPNAFINNFAPAVGDSNLGKIWKSIWEKMWSGAYGDFIEKQAHSLQWQKLKLSLRNASERGDRSVVIADGLIKLHENDRREHYQKMWLEKISSLNLK